MLYLCEPALEPGVLAHELALQTVVHFHQGVVSFGQLAQFVAQLHDLLVAQVDFHFQLGVVLLECLMSVALHILQFASQLVVDAV